jgi:hypothetical protein
MIAAVLSVDLGRDGMVLPSAQGRDTATVTPA